MDALQSMIYKIQSSIKGISPSTILNEHAVASRTSSTLTPGAISINVKPPPFKLFLSQSKTHISVMILSTTAFPVRGKLHLSRIFGDPSFAV
mmetsp:Transcript_25548/g.52813  ORF Transcript_25548/g.52813 Transcript_25548/m.52813 type:complete len:92 (-) Transcript_25548:1525-1800(-)